jgi:hypothetical protein
MSITGTFVMVINDCNCRIDKRMSGHRVSTIMTWRGLLAITSERQRLMSYCEIEDGVDSDFLINYFLRHGWWFKMWRLLLSLISSLLLFSWRAKSKDRASTRDCLSYVNFPYHDCHQETTTSVIISKSHYGNHTREETVIAGLWPQQESRWFFKSKTRESHHIWHNKWNAQAPHFLWHPDQLDKFSSSYSMPRTCNVTWHDMSLILCNLLNCNSMVHFPW